jgi:hypothetical protein
MSGISDGVTIGIVLLLLFGALFFYIWLRVQQIEKRALLLENILLDLKLNTESTFGDEPAPYPQQTRSSVADIASVPAEGGGLDYLSDLMPSSPRGNGVSSNAVELDNDASDYTSVLDEVHETASPKETPSVVAAVMPSASPVSEPSSKMSSNYESMTIKELRALAKTRKVPGVSSLSRAQLIQQLKEKDNGASSYGAAIWGSATIKEDDEGAVDIDGALADVTEVAGAIDA